MKRLLLKFTMVIAVLVPSVDAKGPAEGKGRHSSASESGTPKASKKSSVPGSNYGKYVGGSGSSHKGGQYKNDTTGNEERNRKAGVPK